LLGDMYYICDSDPSPVTYITLHQGRIWFEMSAPCGPHSILNYNEYTDRTLM